MSHGCVIKVECRCGFLPNDEPASVLLERIKAQRDAANHRARASLASTGVDVGQPSWLPAGQAQGLPLRGGEHEIRSGQTSSAIHPVEGV